MPPQVEERSHSSLLSTTFPDHDGRSIGGALREAREREGATLSEFAKRLKISSANLCDLESSRRIPRPRRVAEIAAALGLDREAFLELALEQLLRRENLMYRVKLLSEVAQK